ncbi:unnamed protein product [Vitrella brassicaformis CCMP3155]|uniref:Protein kinase domain-containing protein n=3 Tax=Vitrella brassicaformis TaxID=1169539 RepID=A0A0G4GAY3_VITBC|nr:unnamed protein product [Vitrella brassicaformis CCMP3155]|eukprot:CEM26295.1 unnamed protein product [Vitrella brassicaformis CCMP3155]
MAHISVEALISGDVEAIFAARSAFLTHCQRHGLQIISKWRSLDRPFLPTRRQFAELIGVPPEVALPDFIPDDPDMPSLSPFWWFPQAWQWLSGHDGDEDAAGSHNQQQQDRVEMLHVLGGLAITLPYDLPTRMRALFEIFDFSDLDGTSHEAGIDEGETGDEVFGPRLLIGGAGLFILLERSLTGLSKLCELPAGMLPLKREEIEAIRDYLWPAGASDPTARTSLLRLAPRFIPLLRSLSSILYQKSKILESCGGICGSRDEVLPTLQTDAHFLGRYRVIARERLPSGLADVFLTPCPVASSASPAAPPSSPPPPILLSDPATYASSTAPPPSHKELMLDVYDEMDLRGLAIKVLLPLDSDPAQDARNFVREAALLSKVRHRRWAPVHVYGVTARLVYQVREKEEGCTLAQLLQQRRQSSNQGLPEMDVVEFLLCLLDVLEVAHTTGVVHTALTPHKVFLKHGSLTEPMILDWSSAKWDPQEVLANTSSLLTGMPEATDHRDPRYISPQQCQGAGGESDPSWDIYSIGCIAFECVTLTPPFTGTRLTDAYRLSLGDRQKHSAILAGDAASAERPSSRRRTSGAQQSPGQPDGGTRKKTVTLQEGIKLEHVYLPPPSLEQCLTSSDFVGIVNKALQKEPRGRYLTATDMIRDLRMLLEELQNLPPLMQETLPHLKLANQQQEATVETLPLSLPPAPGGQPALTDLSVPGPPSRQSSDDEARTGFARVLDLRNEGLTAFTSRYLAKFANALLADELHITGGPIPLRVIRQGESTSLNLSDRSLAAHDTMVLARLLAHNSTIEHLDLSKNCVAHENAAERQAHPHMYRVEGLARLAESLPSLPLQVLNLSENPLGGQVGEVICRALGKCPNLRSLHLGHCDIMSRGGVALAESLKHLTMLEELDINHCHIGDDGCKALASSLGASPHLATINLYGNSIEDEGADALVSALEHDFTLLTLPLGDNRISRPYEQLIQRAITFNNQYKSLCEHNSRFEGFGHHLMAESLKAWARGDTFIAKRLHTRLLQPKDPLEEEVGRLLLTSDNALVLDSAFEMYASARVNGGDPASPLPPAALVQKV